MLDWREVLSRGYNPLQDVKGREKKPPKIVSQE